MQLISRLNETNREVRCVASMNETERTSPLASSKELRYGSKQLSMALQVMKLEEHSQSASITSKSPIPNMWQKFS